MKTEDPVYTRLRFVLCENMLASSLTLPMEMLHTANMAGRRRQQSPGQPQLKLQTCSESPTPIQTHASLMWQAELSLEQATDSDIIYLPALWRNPRPVLKRSAGLIDWLQRQHHNGATICAVGTGCCFMAEAGLLDGKVATTHWHYFDQFQSRYPRVHLKRQHFITRANNLYCAASVNSLADLTVYFIQRLMGKSVASHVERHFSHEIRRAYESSAFYDDATHPHPDEQIVQAQLWLQDNYFRQINAGDVAARFEMSLRTFNRRFKNATGITPLEYLRDIRLSQARELLQTSNLSIAEIAEKVGYLDTGYFGELFKRHCQTTPREYRAIVRAKLFSAASPGK